VFEHGAVHSPERQTTGVLVCEILTGSLTSSAEQGDAVSLAFVAMRA
jgi:hypothetical protein